jgi:hypothetical protein
LAQTLQTYLALEQLKLSKNYTVVIGIIRIASVQEEKLCQDKMACRLSRKSRPFLIRFEAMDRLVVSTRCKKM